MEFKELKTAFSAVWRYLRTRQARNALIISVVVAVGWELIVLSLESHIDHKTWLALQAMLGLMGVFGVALGVKAQGDADKEKVKAADPIQALVDLAAGPKAPFAYSQGFALNQQMRLDACADSDRDKVISILVKKLAQPQTPTQYTPDIVPHLRQSATWAICGRKDTNTATALYDAGVNSFEQEHNHVERIFFPPLTPDDATEVKLAIEKHLSAKMTVRVFKPDPTTGLRWTTADLVLHDFHLPRGFGMTLLGESCKANNKNVHQASKTPRHGSLQRVLIHWGGHGTNGGHQGIILESNRWATFFHEQFFNPILQHTEVANSNDPTGVHGGTNSMGWAAFVAKYPEYEKPRGAVGQSPAAPRGNP